MNSIKKCIIFETEQNYSFPKCDLGKAHLPLSKHGIEYLENRYLNRLLMQDIFMKKTHSMGNNKLF